MAQLLVLESFEDSAAIAIQRAWRGCRQRSSLNNSAAITIQRIWRGLRQRSFLRTRYYTDGTDWGSTARAVSYVAVGAFFEEVRSAFIVDTVGPDPCVRHALDQAKCASRQAAKAMKECAAWEKCMLDQSTRLKKSEHWSDRGFKHEHHHKHTLSINETMSGAQKTQFKREHRWSRSDVTTVSKSGAAVEYQMKACKDAAATGKAARRPKYDGIAKVVPSDQCKQINRSDVQDRIFSETKPGVSSNPITLEALDKQTTQARQKSSQAQTAGEKPVKIEAVEQKRKEIKQFEKKSKDTVIKQTKQGCKTAAKAAAFAAGLAALTSLASSIYRLYPKYKRGGISIGDAVSEALQDATRSALATGATGLVMGLVEVLCEHVSPKVVNKLGPGMAALAWLSQVALHVKRWWEEDMSEWELAGRILQTTLSMGAGCGGGFLGCMAGMALLGPIGAIIGGFLGGILAGFCVDNTLVPLYAWVNNTRPTDNLLRALEYESGHWWVKGKADEILSVLEGHGPWGWLRKEPTRQEVSQLVHELGSHFRRVALKYHPDRAALRGDTPKERIDHVAKLKAAKDAYEQLVKLLNDQLVASERFQVDTLCRPVLMLPDAHS